MLKPLWLMPLCIFKLSVSLAEHTWRLSDTTFLKAEIYSNTLFLDSFDLVSPPYFSPVSLEYAVFVPLWSFDL